MKKKFLIIDNMFNKKQLKRISEDIFWIREGNKICNNRIKVLEDKVNLLEQKLDISSRPFIKSDPIQFSYFVCWELLKHLKLEIVAEEVEDESYIAPKRTIYKLKEIGRFYGKSAADFDKKRQENDNIKLNRKINKRYAQKTNNN